MKVGGVGYGGEKEIDVFAASDCLVLMRKITIGTSLGTRGIYFWIRHASLYLASLSLGRLFFGHQVHYRSSLYQNKRRRKDWGNLFTKA